MLLKEDKNAGIIHGAGEAIGSAAAREFARRARNSDRDNTAGGGILHGGNGTNALPGPLYDGWSGELVGPQAHHRPLL